MSVSVVVVVFVFLQQASGEIAPDYSGPSTVEKCVCSPAIYVDYGDRKGGETDVRVLYQLQAQITRLQGTVESLRSQQDILIAEVSNLTAELALLKKGDHEKYVCPSDYVQFLDKCYNFSTDYKNYTAARTICQANGGHLAMPKDKAINDFLVNQVKNRYTSHYVVWFGLTDLAKEGAWVWEDGTPLIWSTWSPGQPDDFRNNQDCAYLGSNFGYRWDDVSCRSNGHYVCEIKATAL